MGKVDRTVLRETAYIAVCCVILSLLLHAAFLIAGRWDMTVLFGNLLSLAAGVLNFFLMGLMVQSVLGLEEKEAKQRIRLSQIYRLLMVAAFAALGLWLPCFNSVAVVVTVLFPRIALAVRPAAEKIMSGNGK